MNVLKRMTLGELKKEQKPIWARWMREAVETLDNSDEIIAHYKLKTMPELGWKVWVLVEITYDVYGPPLN